MERGRSEAGQTAAEYAGVLALIGLIIAGLLSLQPGIGRAVADAIERAWCAITGGHCEDKQAGDPGACVTSTSSGTFGVEGSVAFVTFGFEKGYLTERRSDGTVAVTYSDGGRAGVGADIGAYADFYWGSSGDEAHLGAEAHAQAELTFNSGVVWEFKNEKDAERWISWHRAHFAATDAAGDVVGGGVTAYGMQWLHTGWNGLGHIFGWSQDYETPETAAVYEEVGTSGEAGAGLDATASHYGAGAGADAHVANTLGVRIDQDTEKTTTYIQLDAGVAAQLQAGGWSGEGQAGGTVMVAVTRDKDGHLQRLAVTSIRMEEPGLSPDDAWGPGQVGTAGRADQRFDPHLYQVDAVLDLTDPANRRAYNDLVRAGLLAPVPGLGAAELAQAITAFQDRVRSDGQFTVLEYAKADERYGGGVGAAVGVGGSAGVGLDQSKTNVVNAAYFDHGKGGFVPWTGCLSAA